MNRDNTDIVTNKVNPRKGSFTHCTLKDAMNIRQGLRPWTPMLRIKNACAWVNLFLSSVFILIIIGGAV